MKALLIIYVIFAPGSFGNPHETIMEVGRRAQTSIEVCNKRAHFYANWPLSIAQRNRGIVGKRGRCLPYWPQADG